MPTVSYPGVYVEEIPGGARPIEAASTSTCAFVGEAKMGSDDEALKITSWDGYVTNYGGFYDDTYLDDSVYQFFNNGGKQCYVVRVTRSDATIADVTVKNRAPAPVPGMIFKASSKGAWGNHLVLTLEDGSQDSGNTFKLTLRSQPHADVIPENFPDIPPLEIHDNLSVDRHSSDFVTNILERDSQYLRVQISEPNNSVQRGSHLGGPLAVDADGKLEVSLGAEDRRFLISLDDDGYQLVELSGISDDKDLDHIATKIAEAVQKLVETKKKTSTPDDTFNHFECVAVEIREDPNDPASMVTHKRLKLLSGTNKGKTREDDLGAVTLSSVRVQNSAEQNAAVFLKIGDGNGGLSENALAVRRPRVMDRVQIGDAAEGGNVVNVTEGKDGAIETNEMDHSRQFELLNDKTDFSLLAVPGFGTTVMVDEGMNYCEKRPLKDVFYIGETGEDHDEVEDAEDFRNALTKPNSYGAVYFPWIKALDPSGASRTPILLPPSGYIAGLYARIDNTRGVWKAPAGTEATLGGAVGLGARLTDDEHGNLNPININVIRRFDLAGIVSWGARTITSDPEYKYVPVRRTAIMLRRSIYDGIQWAVFEPNDHRLWSALRTNIGAFMNGLFRAGAFQGEKASDAYFVRCGLGHTMNQGDIDRGQVIVLVGFAALKPAEYVIVRIQQKAGQNQ